MSSTLIIDWKASLTRLSLLICACASDLEPL